MSALIPVGARRRGGGGSPLRRQRGIAMLVAILLVALGTIVAAAVAYESAMATRRGTATFAFDEALLVGQGAEALAAYGLKTVMQNSKAGTSGTVDVYPAQPWAQPVGPLEVVPGVTLEASLEDMQGRFNLNWLVDSGTSSFGGAGTNQAGTQNTGLGGNNGLGNGNTGIPGLTGGPDQGAVRAFNKLLEMLAIDPKWTDMIIDWIDSDNMPQPQGAEDSAYLSQNPPYLTANRYLTSTSELLALPGFGRDNFAKLAPYITALPPSTPLNICTAPAQVLDAFTTQSTFSGDQGQGLAKNREGAPGCFPDLNTYKAGFVGNDLQLAGAQRFVTTSNYFRLSSLVTIGSAEFNLYSLLYMDPQGYLIHPVQRSFTPD